MGKLLEVIGDLVRTHTGMLGTRPAGYAITNDGLLEIRIVQRDFDSICTFRTKQRY
ncbi:MAG: hypothetical protein ABI866_13850 [Dokdonella sp.]